MSNPPNKTPSERQNIYRGLIFLPLAAFSWSLFSLWLASDGHQPSGPALFQNQYQRQALLIPLVLSGSWFAFAGVLWKVLATREPETSFSAWFGKLGEILGHGYLWCWVLPDIIVYALSDFDTLGQVAPSLPVLTTLFVVLFTIRFVRRRVSIGRLKATFFVLMAWIAQAIPVLVFIR